MATAKKIVGVQADNPLVRNIATSAEALATADARTYEPFFNFMSACIIARAAKDKTGMKDKKDFDAYLKEIGVDASNRKSEAWSITKLGDYACHVALLKNLKACKPSKTGLYFAACGVRATGFFAEDSKAGLTPLGGKTGWKDDAKTAPTTEQLGRVIKAAMKESNKDKVKSQPKGMRDHAKAMLKTLKRFNVDGYQRNGEQVAALNDANLTDAINALSAYMKPKLRVVKGGRKAA